MATDQTDRRGCDTGGIIPEVAADLADDHRHRISRKFYVLRQIKIIGCLDQANAAHVKQIIRIFAAVMKALHNT